jgi:flagellar basal-body rod modification protein FlgD
MPAISPTSLLNATSAPSGASSFDSLSSSDFLKLLVTQLTNQDPLEPMDNEAMLRQISSIREIELSTTLTESLRTLSGQQHVGAASAMIGQYVTGMPGEDGNSIRGIVTGVRFAEGGRAVLMLSNGAELPLEQVSRIEPPLRAAETLVGQSVVGLDARDPKNPQVAEGVVTGARLDEKGEAVLELDTGSDLRMRDVVSVATTEDE